MSLGVLQMNKEYFFEVMAVQYDHQGFTQAHINDPNSPDQFALAKQRRLLNTVPRTTQGPFIPVFEGADISASREILSILVPVSKRLTANAVMPQGAVALTQAESTGAFSSSGAPGFVVRSMVGPSINNTLAPTTAPTEFWEVENDMIGVYFNSISNAFDGTFAPAGSTAQTALFAALIGIIECIALLSVFRFQALSAPTSAAGFSVEDPIHTIL
jgi:hypothetical protein